MECISIKRNMPGFEKVVALQKSAFLPEEQYPIDQILKLAGDPNTEYFFRFQKLKFVLILSVIDIFIKYRNEGKKYAVQLQGRFIQLKMIQESLFTYRRCGGRI